MTLPMASPDPLPAHLVDIAANLLNAAFHADLAPVLARAHAAGVIAMVVPGSDVADSVAGIELCRAHAGTLVCTLGVHPHHAKTCDDDTIATLRAHAGEAPVVAIGECGLDFFRDISPREVQERWFAAQIALACELQLPLYMHERDAHVRFQALLAPHRASFPRGVVHCFTGDEAALRAYLDLDLHIGITGWICDERRGLHLRELVRFVPADRLMLETDAPYLIPRSIRPKPKTTRNEPAFLPWVLDAVAECRGEARELVAERSTAVAVEFFGLAGRGG